jgi:Leucine-rich repeat (LRR) protein
VPNNKLTVLPNSVGELSNLVTLAVQYNNLTALPQSIGKLLFMSWLYVDYNRLTSLPDSLGNLPYLYEIYGNNNKLTSLPESIGTLKHLIRLDVFNNRLSALPMGLKNLQTLYAWNNTLQQLPDGMVSLSQIDVRYNQLKTLPIGGWGNVEYLSVHGNPLCPSYTFPVGVKGGFCETQCSIDCPSVRLGNGFCDDIICSIYFPQFSQLCPIWSTALFVSIVCIKKWFNRPKTNKLIVFFVSGAQTLLLLSVFNLQTRGPRMAAGLPRECLGPGHASVVVADVMVG